MCETRFNETIENCVLLRVLRVLRARVNCIFCYRITVEMQLRGSASARGAMGRRIDPSWSRYRQCSTTDITMVVVCVMLSVV